MKKIVSVLLAVLLTSAAFAQFTMRGHSDARNQNQAPVNNMKKVAVSQNSAAERHAAKQTFDLTMNTYTTSYYEEDDDWFCVMTDENYVFRFDIVTPSLVSGTTYTYSDMLTQYSYCTTRSTDDTIRYESASFTYNVSADGIISIEALVNAVGGDIYNISYTTPIATDTTDINIPNCTLSDETSGYWEQYFIMEGINATNDTGVFFYAYTDYIPGIYQYVDGDMGSMIYVVEGTDTTEYEVINGDATVVAINSGYKLDGYFILENLHCYHVVMTYIPPSIEDATDTIEFNVPAATLVDATGDDGIFQFKGSDADDYYFAAVTIYSNQIPGTYQYEDFYNQYTIVYEGNDSYQVTDGHVTVTSTTDGYAVDAYLMAENLVCYHVTMSYVTPYAADTIEINIPAAQLTDLIESDGAFQIRGYDAEEYYYVSIAVRGVSQIAGSYTQDDFIENYTVVYEGDNSIDIYESHATVTAITGGYQVEAYFLGTNCHAYHVTMTCADASINTASTVEVNLYPNPATEMLHVEAEGITRVDIIDMAGRTVLSRMNVENNINISSLANGIYMIRTTTVEGVNTQKFIKK